jgi:tRNA (Thr-GGU) A37 N-methylase
VDITSKANSQMSLVQYGVLYYDGKFSGVFASRSPNRPNGIGLTIVELLKKKVT